MTEKDVQGAVFDKAMRGYQTEQVDNFLDKVALQLRTDAEKLRAAESEKDALKAEYDALKDKMYVLVKKIEEYRADEDNLKSALLNAQRMGENIVREAKQKAETIEREAKIRAEMIVSGAQEQRREEEIEFARIRGEVSQFKASVLDLYRQHIESLSGLPEEEKEPEEELQQPEEEQQSTAEAVAPQPEPAKAPEEVDFFWEKDEEKLKPVAMPAAPEKAAVPEAFRGIRFSD